MHQQTRKERLVQFDILKGIGILLVIIGHTSLSGYPKSLIYGFHMPLFFFCSGVFYKDKPLVEQVKRSINQLIIPYLFFCLIYNILYVSINIPREDPMSFVSEYFHLLNPMDERGYLYKAIWFLPCLFIVRILHTIIRKTCRNNALYLISGGVIYIIGNNVGNIPFFIDTVLSVYIYYVLGHLFYTFNLYKYKISKLLILIFLIIYVSCVVLANLEVNLKYNIYPSYYLVVAVIGIYICYQLSVYIEQLNNRLPIILSFYGKSSITLLGLHRPLWLLLGIPVIWFQLSENVIIFIQICCAIIILPLFHHVLQKYLPIVIGK